MNEELPDPELPLTDRPDFQRALRGLRGGYIEAVEFPSEDERPIRWSADVLFGSTRVRFRVRTPDGRIYYMTPAADADEGSGPAWLYLEPPL